VYYNSWQFWGQDIKRQPQTPFIAFGDPAKWGPKETGRQAPPCPVKSAVAESFSPRGKHQKSAKSFITTSFPPSRASIF